MMGMTASVAGILVSTVLGGVGLPLGVPPAPEDPIMGRVAPEHCLFYMSWAGVASPDPKSNNQTEQLLAEPEVQYFMTKFGEMCGKLIADKLVDNQEISDKALEATLRDSMRIACSMSQQPGAIFIAKSDRPRKRNTPGKEQRGKDSAADNQTTKTSEEGDSSDAEEQAPHAESSSSESSKPDVDIDVFLGLVDFGALVAIGREAPALKARLKTFFQNYTPKGSENSRKLEIVPLEGDDWYLRSAPGMPDNVIWAFYGNYWIFASDETALKNILSRMKTEPPQWWSDIQTKLPIERRAVTVYIDLLAWKELLIRDVDAEKLKETELGLRVLGLSNVTSWIEVWGMEKRGFATKSLLALDGEPQGLLRLISEQSLTTKDLAPIPDDASAALAFKLDLNRAYETILEALEKSDPETKKTAQDAIDKLEKDLGIDLRRGFLKAVGDTWRVYGSANEGGWPITVVSIRDGAALKMAYGRLMGIAKQHLPQLDPPPALGGEITDVEPQLEHFSFAGYEVYCLNCSGVFAPAWCLTQKEMVFGFTPQSVKAYLIRDEKRKSLESLPVVAQMFSQGEAPVGLAYLDSVSCFRSIYNFMLIYAPAFASVMRQNGVQADLSFMPSPPSIYRHLEPSLMTMRRTKHGIETASVSTVPLPSIQGWIALCVISSLCSNTNNNDIIEESRLFNENGGGMQQPDGDAPDSNEPAEANPANKNGKDLENNDK